MTERERADALHDALQALVTAHARGFEPRGIDWQIADKTLVLSQVHTEMRELAEGVSA